MAPPSACMSFELSPSFPFHIQQKISKEDTIKKSSMYHAPVVKQMNAILTDMLGMSHFPYHLERLDFELGK